MPDCVRALAAASSALVCALACMLACKPITTDVDVRLVLPEDRAALAGTNNVSVTLTPDGFTDSFATEGVEFEFQVELDPDDTERELAVFLARDETLLAYGRTPAFTYNGATGANLALFAAFPGALTTFPLAFDLPDPLTLAAAARGWGMVALASDGTALFLDEFTLEGNVAASLFPDGELPAPDDGALVGDALGGVNRFAWRQALVGYRYDPREDGWITLPLPGAEVVGPRDGAAHLVDAPGETLLLFGGGEAADVLAVRLVPGSEADATVRVLEGPVLDGPRRGATAMFLTREGTDEGETALLFGGDQAPLPLIRFVGTGISAGPAAAWTGGRCVQVDRGGAEAWLRVLCAGGIRDGQPTADALVVSVPPVGDATPPVVEERAAFLPVAMADPIWFEDEAAVYAQGEEQLVRVAREDLAAAVAQSAPLRGSGGCAVALGTGATLIVGGVTSQGAAVDRWQLFVPSLDTSAP